MAPLKYFKTAKPQVTIKYLQSYKRLLSFRKSFVDDVLTPTLVRKVKRHLRHFPRVERARSRVIAAKIFAHICNRYLSEDKMRIVVQKHISLAHLKTKYPLLKIDDFKGSHQRVINEYGTCHYKFSAILNKPNHANCYNSAQVAMDMNHLHCLKFISTHRRISSDDRISIAIYRNDIKWLECHEQFKMDNIQFNVKHINDAIAAPANNVLQYFLNLRDLSSFSPNDIKHFFTLAHKYNFTAYNILLSATTKLETYSCIFGNNQCIPYSLYMYLLQDQFKDLYHYYLLTTTRVNFDCTLYSATFEDAVNKLDSTLIYQWIIATPTRKQIPMYKLIIDKRNVILLKILIMITTKDDNSKKAYNIIKDLIPSDWHDALIYMYNLKYKCYKYTL